MTDYEALMEAYVNGDMNGNSPLEKDIRFHLIQFIIALRKGDHYAKALHGQKCQTLLKQYEREALDK